MKQRSRIGTWAILLGLMGALVLTAPVAHAVVVSKKLTDYIKGNDGKGDIILFKDMTNVDLEAYRQSGTGNLLFGVDVNENASGSEKASSQGVTVKSAVLKVSFGAIQKTYSTFSTETQVVVTEKGTTVPKTYYTLLGDSGSNRITSNTIRDKFDSVLTIANVTDNLSTATAAVLEIRLLVTDPALGDPEAFYDFSNGFEDLAILVQADADFLNNEAFGRDEAPVVVLTNPPADTSMTIVTWLDLPSVQEYYWVAYEDLFPLKGDYDFNDLVVPYQVRLGLNDQGQVLKITGTAYLVARGASYDHDWHLRIDLPNTAAGTYTTVLSFPPGDGRPTETSGPTAFAGFLDIPAFEGTQSLLVDPDSIYTNTQADRPFFQGPRFEFVAEMTAPVDRAGVEAGPFDPYLLIVQAGNTGNEGYEIHLIGKLPTPGSRNDNENRLTFTDVNGYPFAMIIPQNWQYPLERVNLGYAYPQFVNFVQTAGSASKTWYNAPVSGKVRAFTTPDWKW